MNNFHLLIFLWVVLTIAWASNAAVTPAEQCPGNEFDDLTERIQVLPCGKTKCRLRKGTNTTVNFRFKPKHRVEKLINQVSATITVLQLPFVGVDGADACGNIKKADGTPTQCPLEAGEEYLYTNVFPIERFYPSVPLRVHWALNDGKSNVICFEVPAAIV